MLFITSAAVLSLLAAFTPAAFGAAVVPEPDGLYDIANIASRRVMDHYRKHPVVGDPIITAVPNLNTETWKVSYLLRSAEMQYVTISGTGPNEDIHVGNSEGDGLVTSRKPTVFDLKRIPGVTEPAYWLLLGGEHTLAVTGYNGRSQLTLERFNETNTLQVWQFFIPVGTVDTPSPTPET